MEVGGGEWEDWDDEHHWIIGVILSMCRERSLLPVDDDRAPQGVMSGARPRPVQAERPGGFLEGRREEGREMLTFEKAFFFPFEGGGETNRT